MMVKKPHVTFCFGGENILIFIISESGKSKFALFDSDLTRPENMLETACFRDFLRLGGIRTGRGKLGFTVPLP